MPKRSSKPPKDENEAAFRMVRTLTERPEGRPAAPRNPHAVALGTLGGRKGGKARAAKLSPERRHDIAKRAAATRWEKRKPKEE